MSGWHPDVVDGGLMPNPSDANNPAAAYNPANPPSATSPLYYGNGCDVRLRPRVLNALISENLSVVDSVGLNYNPASLINLRTAIEYIGQKRIASFAVVAAQGVPTNYYRGALTPPLLGGYNNGQVLCVVPNEKNQSFVRIDVGGGWWVPVLRNDMQELEADDWPAWVPQLIGYFNGAFYMLGIAKSQVPIVLKGTIWFWIRPDGNDITGDGTANTPDKAFRTIQVAWNAVGSRYSASPSSHISLRLGVPGDYEGAWLGPYGSMVSLVGDPGNQSGYRIHSTRWYSGAGQTVCIMASGINSFVIEGVTLYMTEVGITPYGNRGLNGDRSGIRTNNVDIVLTRDHPNHSMMMIMQFGSWYSDTYGWVGSPSSTVRFLGNGFSCEYAVYLAETSGFTDANPNFYTPVTWLFDNIRLRDSGLFAYSFCAAGNGGCRRWINQGCTGPRFRIGDLSRVNMAGQPLPGDANGSIGDLSIFRP